MPSQNQKAAQTIRQTKQDLTAEQRVQGWQQARVQQGLSGEFAVAAKLGEQAFPHQVVIWLAVLLGGSGLLLLPGPFPRRDMAA